MLSSENIALDEKTLEEELQNAIAEENYAKAAEIRDTLKSLHKDSKTEVLGANNKFYNSFRNGDLAAMQAMWAKRDEVNPMNLVSRNKKIQDISILKGHCQDLLASMQDRHLEHLSQLTVLLGFVMILVSYRFTGTTSRTFESIDTK
ncbi:uncharacterized protein LOC123913261 isoform X1 [Trifolium pratense]|uniref:uncharacterized protein LOC123881869 isoform X1 n=1 Tax=Trifolium pratense TaxID=57577 RepID=UPI001E6958AA|nr:uncharacterized protein LOC123881869 isoform X1 [Trifolium pratense]XP_045786576.1 uncharacterized protein LOC123881869 isoform X1 [Trifolium pratense]XP_045792769.1 uncharacterized protein LOC123887488 isoform X1 [Trifolium pratense]XP_045792770.1 uncharacterized protein LOC123887488 isoform X1 [Trifolium pratense]XP_045819900.1 uncharacterized protein LOC123913261 isoform X1 [Trifolium pratense]XP_045819901.1 uncharacterized protein LOC123913261 isoform X1 [Trifolium pratense]